MTHTPATVQAASSPDGVYLIVTVGGGVLRPIRLTAGQAERLVMQLTRARVEHEELVRVEGN